MPNTLILMQKYAEHRGIALSTLGRLAAGSSTAADRIASGRMTVAIINRIEQWLSENWPDGELDWPADIARPTEPAHGDAA